MAVLGGSLSHLHGFALTIYTLSNLLAKVELIIYSHFLTMVTSPLPLILMMEEGVWGFFSCRRDVHT